MPLQERVEFAGVGDLTTNYQAYGQLAVIHELEGYDESSGSREPIWGDRFGAYHPVTSEITRLTGKGWQVFDAVSSGSEAEAESILSALDDAEIPSIVSTLADRRIIMPSGETVRVPFETDVSPQELYIELTEACNFGCAGCAVGVDRYEAGLSRTMDEPMLDMLLERTVASGQEKGMKKLHIKWAGGEPLMPKPFELVRHGQDKIQELHEQNPDIDVTQVIISKGAYLSDEVVSSIKEMGDDMHVSVSLWGLGETQDRLRGARRERDRFPNIVHGIRRLHEAGIDYNIHHVLTPENAKEFGDFIEAVWDTESDNFMARDWDWPDGKKPLPVTISFFRPQTKEQLAALNQGGHQTMVNGLRGGFDVIRELVKRGAPVPAIGRLDYLQLFRVVPTVCGSGFNYLAAGPRGIAPCHEKLFSMTPNRDQLLGTNVIDLANQEYAGEQHKLVGVNIANPGADKTTALTLALHGGAGCPITTKLENNGELGVVASIAREVYPQILPEVLALEAMRREASQIRRAALAG